MFFRLHEIICIYFYKHKIKGVESTFLSTNSTKSSSINSTLISVQLMLHFHTNKNKISQYWQLPKTLENLILTPLHPFLFIHPRHQCHTLHMFWVELIAINTAISTPIVIGNISTLVDGNMSNIGFRLWEYIQLFSISGQQSR